MGQIEQSLLRQMRRDGNVSERIAKKPVLQQAFQYLFNAFIALDTSRINGFGIGRIPYSEIAFYSVFNGIENFTVYFAVISAVDANYVAAAIKQQEKKKK
jgi:hypothetical protein